MMRAIGAVREMAAAARIWLGFVAFWMVHRRCPGVRRIIDEDRGHVSFWCPGHGLGIAFGGPPAVTCSAEGCERDSPCPACAYLAGQMAGPGERR